MRHQNGLTRRQVLKCSAALAAGSTFARGTDCQSVLPESPGDSVGAAAEGQARPAEPPAFERVTLEMSLKPFRVMDEQAIRSVCATVFRQWEPLIRRCQGCAVLLWTADGSEILEYCGRLDDEIEWARYIGIPNPPKKAPASDPGRRSIHSAPRLYMKDPPRISYRWLKKIVTCLKEVGQAATGKPVLVGATFDPGPEFARSPFKYERHPEISPGNFMEGDSKWVSCAAVLHAEARPYAGFPQGIPEGTSMGTFLGRQSRRFLGDLGFDYLWLSNGFGFSLSAWSVKGPVFDGKRFDAAKAPRIRDEILSFWRDFRRECPEFPVETRGSNLSTGADLSSGASPLGDIYRGGFRMTPPPNSPWAAIDGDFGLEIVGYLSHIAELPAEERFPFRFYTHDPWWLNSPWFDRYGRQPHDIYLPLAIARIDRRGRVTRPAIIDFLTIDNSYGQMPDACPLEVIPHVLTAMDHYSDEPGLLTWVYPFREYHELVFGPSPRLDEPFFGDWFMRGAVNAGLPLNSVVSTDNFLASRQARPDLYRRSILLTPVPQADSPLERELLTCVETGHDVLLYGPVAHAGKRLLGLLNLQRTEPLSGELDLRTRLAGDLIADGSGSRRINHRAVVSAGGIDTVAARPGEPDWEVLASVASGETERVYAVIREKGGGANGRMAWVRGSFSCTIGGGNLPAPDNPQRLFQSELLLRWMLSRFGYRFQVEKPTVGTRNPLVLAARSDNGLFFSGYCPSTVVNLRLRFPYGAPLLIGRETWLEGGCSTYKMPRAWHHEVRCLVDQEKDGEVSCVERHSENLNIRRRLWLRGLKDATVHFYPERREKTGRVIMAANDLRFENEQSLPYAVEDDGRRLVAGRITGELLISW